MTMKERKGAGEKERSRAKKEDQQTGKAKHRANGRRLDGVKAQK